MTTPMGPAPADFELVERRVKLTCGKEAVVHEMTLRQRDRVAAQLQDLSSDEDVKRLVEPFLAKGEEGAPAGEISVDVVSLVRAVAARVGDGALTRFLVTAVLDAPENRELFAGASAEEWALDNLRLRDETNLLSAFKDCNDLGKYMGNLLGLLSLGAEVRKQVTVAEA